MFKRRLKIMLGVLCFVIAVLLARLFQFQVLWYEGSQDVARRPPQSQRVLETCRGAILTRDGKVLACDELQFDLAVDYANLLYDYSQRHGLWDKRLQVVRAHRAVPGLAPPSNACAQCHLAGGSTTGSRTKIRQFRGRCMECHADAADWKTTLARVSGRPLAELNKEIDDLVERIERMREAVQRRERERRGIDEGTDLGHIRIKEELQPHVLQENIPLECAMMIETAPEHYLGLKVKTDQRRVVRDGTLAPHVLGMTGAISPRRWDALEQAGRTWSRDVPLRERSRLYRKDDAVGVSGVERAYEDELRGGRGWQTETVIFRTLRLDRKIEEEPPHPGHNVVLTIDENLQRAANAALKWASEGQLQLTRGGVVVMDPDNGEVLAMAAWPTYDMNKYREPAYFDQLVHNKFAPLLNRPVAAQLPPGSVFKLVTASAGLQSGAITPETLIHCDGYIIYRGRRFRCHGPDGSIAVETAIERSCNVFIFRTAERVGGERLFKFARLFGFGAPTGIDLPAERSGNLVEPRSLFDVFNMGIGHGKLLVTPLQIARMVAVFANGGSLVTPHVMLRIEDGQGRVLRRFVAHAVHLPIRPDYIDLIRLGMGRVVEHGTARHSGLSRFSAAGKTGTAELWRGSDVNHVWFAGYLPRLKPKYAFAVVSERTPGQGGSVAAVIATKMFELYEESKKELAPPPVSPADSPGR